MEWSAELPRVPRAYAATFSQARHRSVAGAIRALGRALAPNAPPGRPWLEAVAVSADPHDLPPARPRAVLRAHPDLGALGWVELAPDLVARALDRALGPKLEPELETPATALELAALAPAIEAALLDSQLPLRLHELLPAGEPGRGRRRESAYVIGTWRTARPSETRQLRTCIPDALARLLPPDLNPVQGLPTGRFTLSSRVELVRLVLPVAAVRALAPGHVLLASRLSPRIVVGEGRHASFRARWVMDDVPTTRLLITGSEPDDAEATRVHLAPSASKAEVWVAVELVSTRFSLQTIASWAPGQIVELPVAPTDPVRLKIDGEEIGRARLVKVGRRVGFRILPPPKVSP